MEEEDNEEVFKNNGKLVSVFSPRLVCGQMVEPFCEPTIESQQAYMVAGATNLVWWAMHEALADGKTKDALKCGDIMLDILRHEVSKEEWSDAKVLLLEIIKQYNESDSPPSSPPFD
jgi:hypothetical protein